MPTNLIPISPITDEIREYLASDVLRAVTVSVPDEPALADVQPAFDALPASRPPAHRTRFRRATLGLFDHCDALGFGLVCEHLCEAV